MNKTEKGFAVVCIIVAASVLYLQYWASTQPKQYADIGLEGDQITFRSNTINVTNLGGGNYTYYCNVPELYIQIGNATMVLRDINGTIYIEGAVFVPETK